MKNFTEEQITALDQQAREIFDHIAEGQSVRDLMAQLYVDHLDDKTLRQGQVMADAIIASIQNFDSDFSAARENITRYVDDFIEKICQEKTPAERCSYLLKLGTAIGGAQEVMEADTDEQKETMEELIHTVEASMVSDEEASEALEAELKQKLRDGLLNSGIMLSSFIRQEEQLQEMEDADEAASLLLRAGTQETDFRAVMSMLAYVNVKNGTFDNMPPELTADQVATLVCAHSEQVHIMEAVEQGSMAVDVAASLLDVLGVVVIARLCIGTAFVGLAICQAMFGWILTIPAFLIVLTGMMHVMSNALDFWSSESRRVVDVTTVGVRALRNGASRIAGFVKDKLLPHVVKAANALLSGVKQILSRLKKGRRGESESSSEFVEDETAELDEEDWEIQDAEEAEAEDEEDEEEEEEEPC